LVEGTFPGLKHPMFDGKSMEEPQFPGGNHHGNRPATCGPNDLNMLAIPRIHDIS